jgi:hypothetical protein
VSSFILKRTAFNFESLNGFLCIGLRVNRISEPFSNQIFLLSNQVTTYECKAVFLPILVSPN